MGPAIIDAEKNKAGMLYGVFSFALWGVLPLYWKLLQAVPPLEIFYHRIFWSFLIMVAVVLLSNKWKDMVIILSDKRKLAPVFLCGILVSVNWYIFIYAVNINQVIEASMGYCMNPLVMVLFGVTIFRERLNRWQLSALVLAVLGVTIVTVQYGRIPWIALVLAGCFATYGLVKKIVSADSIIGLTTETLIVMPVALFFILKLETGGKGTFVTAPFTLSHLISFCFIWAGLVIFTMSNVGILRESLPVQAGK